MWWIAIWERLYHSTRFWHNTVVTTNWTLSRIEPRKRRIKCSCISTHTHETLPEVQLKDLFGKKRRCIRKHILGQTIRSWKLNLWLTSPISTCLCMYMLHASWVEHGGQPCRSLLATNHPSTVHVFYELPYKVDNYIELLLKFAFFYWYGLFYFFVTERHILDLSAATAPFLKHPCLSSRKFLSYQHVDAEPFLLNTM